MPASQRSARALFLRFTLVASRTWPGEKGKTQHVTQLPLVPMLGCPTLRARAGRDEPGQPFPHVSQGCTSCKLGGLMRWSTWWCEGVGSVGWHTSKDIPWEDGSGRRCLAASRSLQVSPSWPLPAQLNIAPSLPREGRAPGLGPFPRGSCTLSVPGASNLCPETALELHVQAGKQSAAYFQHVTPLGRTRQPPLDLLLVVFGLQQRQWESLRTVITVLLRWKITPCMPKRRFAQGGPAQPAESGTRWAPIHFCIFHTRTHWVTHTHIRTLTKTYALCMCYIYAHTCTHRNN